MRDGDNCLQDGSPVHLCNYLYRCVSFMSDMCVCLSSVCLCMQVSGFVCVCVIVFGSVCD